MGLRMDADRECHFSELPTTADSSDRHPCPLAATVRPILPSNSRYPLPPHSPHQDRFYHQLGEAPPGGTAYDRSQPNCDEAQLEERLFGGQVDIN